MKISVVVPTIRAREAWLDHCLKAYALNSRVELELLVIHDKPNCGTAWAEGAEQATGDYIHFTADDIEPKLGWDEAAIAACDAELMPIATVFAPDGSLQRAQVPYTGMSYDAPGTPSNVLVPFLSRKQFELGGWAIPIHYGSDDWITYLAIRREIPLIETPAYAFVHHAAEQGRRYDTRPYDLAVLAQTMYREGYLPPFYRRLSEAFNPS